MLKCGVAHFFAASLETPLGEVDFDMVARHDVKTRTVRQQLWARRVDCRRDSGTCLIAREIDASDGLKPIEWRLLSNRDVELLAQAQEIIDWLSGALGDRDSY